MTTTVLMKNQREESEDATKKRDEKRHTFIATIIGSLGVVVLIIMLGYSLFGEEDDLGSLFWIILVGVVLILVGQNLSGKGWQQWLRPAGIAIVAIAILASPIGTLVRSLFNGGMETVSCLVDAEQDRCHELPEVKLPDGLTPVLRGRKLANDKKSAAATEPRLVTTLSAPACPNDLRAQNDHGWSKAVDMPNFGTLISNRKPGAVRLQAHNGVEWVLMPIGEVRDDYTEKLRWCFPKLLDGHPVRYLNSVKKNLLMDGGAACSPRFYI